MKRWFLIFTLFIMSLATAATQKLSSDQIVGHQYELYELDNQLRVLLIKTDYPNVVSLHIPVQTGSRNEVEPGKSGFAHFFEHMMFRGTPNYPQDVYGEILKNAGADQNAYTTDDYTNYHLTFDKEDLETVLKLEADRFQNLAFSLEQFQTEALAVKGEYLKNFSNPISKLFEVLRDKSFQKHTYKHTTMGFFEDIEAMPNQYAYSQEFYKRWYRPDLTTVIVVGDIDVEQTLGLVEKYWGNWQRDIVNVDIPKEPKQVGANKLTHVVAWEAPTQAWILGGFKGTSVIDNMNDMAALVLLSELWYGANSQIYKQIVIDGQYADQYFSYFPLRKDPHLLMFGARLTDPKHYSEVQSLLLNSFAQVKQEPVDERKLNDLKSNIRYNLLTSLDNSEAIASYLATMIHFDRDPKLVDAWYAALDAVTSEDILRVANKYFIQENFNVVSLNNGEKLAAYDKPWEIPVYETQQADVKLVEQHSQSPIIDMNLLFNTGAAAEPEGKKGITALTASLLISGGSQNLTYSEIKNLRYPLAGHLGWQVDKEMLVFRSRIHKDNLDAWYKLVKEQLLNPGFKEHDFNRVKTQLLNMIKSDLKINNDEELGKEVLYQQIFAEGHPYHSYNLGSISDLESITLEDVKAHYANMLTQSTLTVGLTGNYDSEFKQKLLADLASLPKGDSTALSIPSPQVKPEHHAIIVDKETTSTAVSFGFPIEVTRGHPDWVALWLARSWLGEHRSSNSYLYQRIREIRGMNYGDYAYIEYFPRGMFQFHPDANSARQQQIFQVWIRPLRSHNDAVFATRVALYELTKMIEHGISEEDFNATKNYLNKFVGLLVKSQDRQLGYALDSEYYNIPEFVEYVRAGLSELTVDQVNAVIKKHLQLDDVQFAFITQNGAALKELLVSSAETPMTYNTNKPSSLLEEDKIIAKLPLKFSEETVNVVPLEAVFK